MKQPPARRRDPDVPMRRATPRKSGKAAVIDAAIVMLGRSPHASLSLIAESAGVSRATLHRHFASRDALVNAVAMQAIEETDEAVASIDYEAMGSEGYLLAMFEAIIPLGDRYHFLSSLVPSMLDEAIAQSYARQLGGLEETVGWLKDEGLVGQDVPTDWAVLIIDSLIYSAWTAVHEGFVAPRNAAALACRTALQGLTGRG